MCVYIYIHIHYIYTYIYIYIYIYKKHNTRVSPPAACPPRASAAPQISYRFSCASNYPTPL